MTIPIRRGRQGFTGNLQRLTRSLLSLSMWHPV